MKKLISKYLILSLLIAMVTGCSDDDFTGSDTLITVTRDLPDFSRIEAGDVVEVRVSFGQTQTVDVTVNDNLVNQLRTEVSNGILNISLEPGSFNNATFIVEVQLPNLEGLRLEDASRGTLGYNTMELDLETTDASNMEIEGFAQVLNVQTSGSSGISGFDFTADAVNVTARGASELQITCNDALNGTVEDAAEVQYRGMPTVNVQTSQAGRVVNAN